MDWGNATVEKITLILTQKFSLELQITELVIRHYPTKICPLSDKILPAVNDWADQIPDTAIWSMVTCMDIQFVFLSKEKLFAALQSDAKW